MLNREFNFTLDVCASAQNAKLKRYFSREHNGLLRSWKGETIFMNPPYSEVGKWVARAYGAAQNEGALVVCLIPSRTGTRWWHDYAMKGEVRFIRGRLRFGVAKADSPFDSAVVVFRPKEFKLESWPA